MRIAIVSANWNDWAAVPAFLAEIESALASHPQIQPSVWLVDDGSTQRPPSWNALATGRLETHVIELQGHHGAARALATALGFLVCELEAGFDAFLLLESRKMPANLGTLLETAGQSPEAVVVTNSPRAGLLARALFRLGTGYSFGSAPFLFLPPKAAEALCHSRHAGNHLSSALTRLRIPRVATGGREKSGRRAAFAEELAALTVFRERVFARLLAGFSILSALLALALVVAGTLALTQAAAIPALAFVALALSFFFVITTAALTLALSLHSQSLHEMRPWTPALDATTLVRAVNRVRREPYGLERGQLSQ